MTLVGLTRSPQNILFGEGQREALAAYAAPLGRKALVVTDARLVDDAMFTSLMSGLEAAGVRPTIYSDIAPELPLSSIADGVSVGREAGCDLVIGIGGGSCLDAAKIISLLLSHGGTPADYYGELKVPGPVLPLIAMPTTSGTGSEVTPVAVLHDPDRAVKVGIASPFLIPQTAICDPELTYTCPPALTASAGADALTHAIEAFTTVRRNASPDLSRDHVFIGKNVLSDHHALRAIREISAGLAAAYRDGTDREARRRLMLGALLAGLAFGVAGTAAAHAIQYPIGAATDTPHGVGVAMLMPYVMAFNAEYCQPEFAQVAKAMGVASADAGETANARAAVGAVVSLFAEVRIPATARDLGLDESKLDWTAELALGATRLIKNNPRPLDLDNMRELVRSAFYGQLAA